MGVAAADFRAGGEIGERGGVGVGARRACRPVVRFQGEEGNFKEREIGQTTGRPVKMEKMWLALKNRS